MNGYSKRAIGELLNNAVAATQNPASVKVPFLNKNKNRLLTYTRELIQPAIDHLEEGFFSEEELVYAFTVAAFWLHTFRILKTDKLPMIESVEKFYNKKEKTKLPQLEVKCPECKHKFEV